MLLCNISSSARVGNEDIIILHIEGMRILSSLIPQNPGRKGDSQPASSPGFFAWQPNTAEMPGDYATFNHCEQIMLRATYPDLPQTVMRSQATQLV